jgi:hypothetical protein
MVLGEVVQHFMHIARFGLQKANLGAPLTISSRILAFLKGRAIRPEEMISHDYDIEELAAPQEERSLGSHQWLMFSWQHFCAGGL